MSSPSQKTTDMNTGLLSHYQPRVCEKKEMVSLRQNMFHQQRRGEKMSATCNLFPFAAWRPLAFLPVNIVHHIVQRQIFVFSSVISQAE